MTFGATRQGGSPASQGARSSERDPFDLAFLMRTLDQIDGRLARLPAGRVDLPRVAESLSHLMDRLFPLVARPPRTPVGSSAQAVAVVARLEDTLRQLAVRARGGGLAGGALVTLGRRRAMLARLAGQSVPEPAAVPAGSTGAKTAAHVDLFA